MTDRPSSSGDDRVTEWHQKDTQGPSPTDFSALSDAAARPMEQPTPLLPTTASLPSSPLVHAASFRTNREDPELGNVDPELSNENPAAVDGPMGTASNQDVDDGDGSVGKGEGDQSPSAVSSHRQKFDSSPLDLDDPQSNPSLPQFSAASPQQSSPMGNQQVMPPASSEGSRQFHKRMVLTGGLSALEGDSSCSSDDERHGSSNSANRDTDTYERIADDSNEGTARGLSSVGGKNRTGQRATDSISGKNRHHNLERSAQHTSVLPTHTKASSSIEGNIEGLYTFQKRSLRQSRDNWKASNGGDNAFAFPKTSSSILRMLNVVMKRNAPVPQDASPGVGTAIVLPSQVKKDVQAPKRQAPKPNSEGNGRQGEATSKSGRAPTPSCGLLDAPPDVVMTCVLPAHSQPPATNAYSRPPSESFYQSFTSPPSTASQLLARNLVGFRPLQSAMGSTHMSGKSISGDLVQPFQASSSIIGSLRPNSVLKLPPIAVSTSEDVSLQPEKRHPRDQLKPPLPSTQHGHDAAKPMRKPAKQKSVKEQHEAFHYIGNVSDPSSSVGDPQEMFVGGTFTTVPPTHGDLNVFPMDEGSWTVHPGHTALLQAVGVELEGVTREEHRTDDNLPLTSTRDQEGLSASLAHYRQGALRDVSTPTRLQSFGLKPTRSYGLPSSPRVSSKLLAMESVNGETSMKGANVSGPQRHPEILPQRRKETDVVGRVEEVCRWGYDLRSLFLAQLEREGTTAAQFCAKHKKPFDVMVSWIQHGHPVHDSSGPATTVKRTDLAEQMQSLTRLVAEYVGSTLFRGKNNVAPKFKGAPTDGSNNNGSTLRHGPRNVFQPPDVMDVSTLAAADGALDGEARGQLRKVLVTQSLGINEFCSLCSLLIGQAIPRDEVKMWLEDPSVSSKKVERAAAFFLKYNNTLRSEFMKCLDWNRHEADAMQWYEVKFVEQRRERLEIFRQVLESEGGRRGVGAPPPAETSATEGAVVDGEVRQEALRMEAESMALSHTEALALAVIAKYQQSHHANKGGEGNTNSPHLPSLMSISNGDVAKKLRSVLQSTGAAMSSSAARVDTVEEFSAEHFISHADVCAWLAHSPRFDKSVLSFVWNFVAAHHQQRPQRSRLVELLDNLLASVEATDDELFVAMEAEEQEYAGGALQKLADHRAKNATPSVEVASDLMDATLRFLDGTSSTLTIPKRRSSDVSKKKKKCNEVTPSITYEGLSPSKCKRVPQDQFVLESVISKLCMEDSDDYHRGALHGGGVASQMIHSMSNSKSPRGRAAHWRDLADAFPRHQELLFEQEAQLMRQLVKKRADPHHRNDFEKLKGRWRQEGHTRSDRDPTAREEDNFVPLCRQSLHRLEGVDVAVQSPLRIEERHDLHEKSNAPVAAKREGLLRKDWLAAIEQNVKVRGK